MSRYESLRQACQWPRREDLDGEAVTVIVRICDCGCNQRLDQGASERARYASERHRHKAYRDRVKREAEAAGLPSRLTLESVHATSGPRQRVGDAQSAARKRTRRPRPGVSAYFRTVEQLDWLIALVESEPEPGPDDDSPPIEVYLEARESLRRARARRP